MTVTSDRLPGAEELLHEADRIFIRPQMIGIRHAARQDQRVILSGADILDDPIDREGIALLGVVVHRLDRPRLE